MLVVESIRHLNVLTALLGDGEQTGVMVNVHGQMINVFRWVSMIVFMSKVYQIYMFILASNYGFRRDTFINISRYYLHL